MIDLMRGQKGLILAEALVVIALIAILAVSLQVFFFNAAKDSKDSKRKADVQAIALSYEAKFDPINQNYQELIDSDFFGVIPYDPDGQQYYRDNQGTGFKVCAALEDNPDQTCTTSSDLCYCLESTQGDYIASVTPTPTETPTESPTATPPVCDLSQKNKYGVTLGAGIFTYQAEPAVQKAAAELEFGWIRGGTCGWSRVEGGGNNVFNWTQCDLANQVMHVDNGFDILSILDTSISWCWTNPNLLPSQVGHDPPCTNSGAYTDFKDYVSRVVARYGPNPNNLYGGSGAGYGKNWIHYWEIGNEPDLKRNWKTLNTNALYYGSYGGPYKAYVNMLQAAYEAIKAADPTATVSFGGLALPDAFNPGANQDPDFFQGIMNAGAGPYFDITNFHTYSGMAESTNKWNYMRDLLNSNGYSIATKPVWITEVGMGSGDRGQASAIEPESEANQALYIGQYVPFMLDGIGGAGVGAQKVFVHDLYDNPADNSRFCTHGLLCTTTDGGVSCDTSANGQCSGVGGTTNANFREKPAFATFRQVICQQEVSGVSSQRNLQQIIWETIQQGLRKLDLNF